MEVHPRGGTRFLRGQPRTFGIYGRPVRLDTVVCMSPHIGDRDSNGHAAGNEMVAVVPPATPHRVPPASSEATVRAMLDAAPDAMVGVAADGTIIMVNLQAETLFGYPRRRLLGQSVDILVPVLGRDIHGKHRGAYFASPKTRPMGAGLELAGRRADGTQFPAEISLSSIETETGTVALAAIRDVTARKRVDEEISRLSQAQAMQLEHDISVRKAAEGHLAQMEGRYRGLLEAAPDAMVVVDQAGDIVLLNVQAEKRFGYQRDELLGQPVTNIIPEGFAERLIADDLRSAADALAQQIGTGIELSARRKDGTEFPIEIMLSPLESADGILVTAAIRDISVRKAAENQLLQAQKLESIGRLAGGIAHDFNNMLFAIHGYAELLTQDLAAADGASFDAQRLLLSVNAISHAAERAAALTAQLLAFSRQQIVTPKVLDLNATVTLIEPMLDQLIGENMRLVLKLDAAAGHIRADAGQIDQIVVNLVVNARDAMPSGGRVTIETGNVAFEAPYAIEHIDVKAGPYVLLAVTDTGVGMDRATREHIFEPFFTTKRVGMGTGLGLATTYGIVRQAGGHIWVYSEPGRGSTFKLYFPRVDAAVEAPPPVTAHPTVGAGTILVVEDEPAVRDMTTQLLKRAGYDVVAVGDGAEAIATAGLGQSFDVLVSDVVMPNLSGIDLAVEMMDRYPQLGVVLLSGYTAETLDLERVTARGATFVPKPITSNQLLQAVLHAVASRRAAGNRG